MTQETALSILTSGRNVFLTGEAGSGKTYLMQQYIRYLRSHGISAAVTASTGVAATHLNGVTLHSWCGIIPGRPHDPERLRNRPRLVHRIQSTSVLIIDEISMLSAAILDVVDATCRTLRNRQEPFGGLQVVVVGDFYQLPPISKHDEPPAAFAYTADSWDRAQFSVCYLTEQHRHVDRVLSSILGDIRSGAVTEETYERLTERHVDPSEDAVVPTRLYTHVMDVDRQNTHKLGQLSGDTRTFQMSTRGSKALVAQLVKGCLSPEQLDLKIGAAVMCTRNNPDLGFVNGTLGTVVDFDEDEGYPIVETKQGSRLTIPPMEWSIEDGEKTLANITQIPLRLAWAITVHKSQGMSLDAAILDLSRVFVYGQGYVALSRVRTIEGVYLAGLNARALQVDPEIRANDQLLRTQSEQTESAWQALGATEQKQQQDAFIRACGGKIKKTHTRPARDDQASSGTYQDRLERIRAKYPRAYTPWTPEDDAKLNEMAQKGTKVKELAQHFQRQPSAIRARLGRLGVG